MKLSRYTFLAHLGVREETRARKIFSRKLFRRPEKCIWKDKEKVYSRNSSRGFSLVETLVAISILSISILGTFTAVQSSLTSSSFLKDQITAMYLIQDAMESVRNMRDTNDLVSFKKTKNGEPAVSWLAGMSESSGDPCYFGRYCRVDSTLTAPSFTYCGMNEGQCEYLFQNDDKDSPYYKSFGYTSSLGWKQSRFKREIFFETSKSGNENEIVVRVTVYWTSGTFSKSLTISQSFFNLH